MANIIHTFTDANECTDFLTDKYEEKVIMIISGSFCKIITGLIHNQPQLRTIYILCRNKTLYEQWAKNWCEIRSVYTDMASTCKDLQLVAYQSEKNDISISFLTTRNDVSKKKLDQLEPTFMYTQIIKEILLTINFEEKHFQEFIECCHVDEEGKLNNVNKLQSEYHVHKPIWWYTREGFLYSTLNRALRLTEVNVIIKMGCFIHDLHQHIQQLHLDQYSNHHSNDSFTVYRGQAMSKANFNEMQNIEGGLISFNNFLSTSRGQGTSLLFAEASGNNSDMVEILFVMTIDPSKSTTPFASIETVSHVPEEDEILFSMHTVFRIDGIKPLDEKRRLFQVDLTLTNDSDKDLLILTNRIREETFPDQRGWFRLGLVLYKMGHYKKVEEIYKILLETATNESEKATIYSHLGMLKDKQRENREAISLYEKSYDIRQKLW